MLTSCSAFCEYRRGENKHHRNLNSGNESGETVGGLAKGGHADMSASINSLFVYVRTDGEIYVLRSVLVGSHTA